MARRGETAEKDTSHETGEWGDVSEQNWQDTGIACGRQARGDLSMTPRFLRKSNEWRSRVLAGKPRAQRASEQVQVDLSSRHGTQGTITLVADVLPPASLPPPHPSALEANIPQQQRASVSGRCFL